MGGKWKILAMAWLTWLAGITPSRWCALAAGVAEMISWIGLTKRGSHAEGEDISPNAGGDDATVLFCIPETPGWKHLTRFCRQYAWIWEFGWSKSTNTQQHSEDKGEKVQLTPTLLSPLFSALLLTVFSQQEQQRRCATSCSLKTTQSPQEQKKATEFLVARKYGSGVVTSPLFLLLFSVGNQLLLSGETPFVD